MAVAELPALPVLLTDDQVAELTGLKTQTLCNWRCRHIGPPFIRLGNRAVRYDRAAVLEWIEDSTVNTAGASPRN